jgi:hypothetical protein
VGIVEYWNGFIGIRVDLFGWIDLIAIKPGVIMAVQTTSASNQSARVKKIRSLPSSKAWLDAGGKIWVMGWKKGKDGHWLSRTMEGKLDVTEISFGR